MSARQTMCCGHKNVRVVCVVPKVNTVSAGFFQIGRRSFFYQGFSKRIVLMHAEGNVPSVVQVYENFILRNGNPRPQLVHISPLFLT